MSRRLPGPDGVDTRTQVTILADLESDGWTSAAFAIGAFLLVIGIIGVMEFVR